MPDYQKAKIYAIMSPHTTDIYIGSTVQPLDKRFTNHKCPSNTTVSKKITDLGDAYIHLIEEYSCNTKEELLERERSYIENTLFCINKYIVGRTDYEYYKDNKERIMEYQRLYRAAKKLTPS